ncbi:MAG: hypothetical protein V7727_13505 [Sneathiella sp.]
MSLYEEWWQGAMSNLILIGSEMKFVVCLLPILLLAVTAQASQIYHSQVSKYSGQEKRSIKSLSPDDISELRKGGGWGLAKAAELNGMPGPVHLLELKDKIPLSVEQVLALDKIYKAMKIKAIKQGERLITLEQELELLFRSGSVTPDTLRSTLSEISKTRMALRFTHLAAHLKSPEILSKEQIATYNEIRGYSNADPCHTIPEGHDKAKWLKHNGCS